ncbi:MAG TPA: hypothetical protein VIJ23_03510 [Mycobacterium sp.]
MPTPTHTPKPARPTATERQILAAARWIARRQLSYGYFRSIDAPTAPFVYCPHRHKVEATVPGAATAAQVCAALRVRLIEHLIDIDETHPTAGR